MGLRSPASAQRSTMRPRTSLSLRSPLCLVGLLVLWAQAALGSPLDRTIDDYVHDVMAKRHIPGLALAVIQKGRVQRVAAFGQASLEFSVPATPATLFPIASVTKSFTAVAVMKLVEVGRV